MALRLNPKKPVEYVLRNDTSDNPATFFLKQIPEKKYPQIIPLLDRFKNMLLPKGEEEVSPEQLDQIKSMTPSDILLNASDEDIEILDELTKKVLKFSICDWKNIQDEDGNDLEFNIDILEETIAEFPFIAKIQIAFNAISLTTGGTLTGE